MKKTVLITGSSRGIGKAIGILFAKNDFNVVLNCIENKDILNSLVKEINKYNENVIGICADVSKFDEVLKLEKLIKERFGTVDILINNAGISYVGLFSQMESSQWQKIIETNLYSVINCSNVFVKPMIEKKIGSIINLSSIWGITGASCEVVYSATKGAVNSFSKALAKELGPCNIRVNSVVCGVVETEMNGWLNEYEKTNLTEDIPLSRFAKPDEIADLCFYLASEKSTYITGQNIVIDGGMI